MPSNPDDIRIHDGITQIMNQSRVNSVWLSIVKINHTKWTWIDGTVQGIIRMLHFFILPNLPICSRTLLEFKTCSYSCGLSTATLAYSPFNVHYAFSDQGQGHGVKFFSIYHNTNC